MPDSGDGASSTAVEPAPGPSLSAPDLTYIPDDPAVMKEAKQRMELMREEIYRKHGLLDIGVPSIREFRDGE